MSGFIEVHDVKGEPVLLNLDTIQRVLCCEDKAFIKFVGQDELVELQESYHSIRVTVSQISRVKKVVG